MISAFDVDLQFKASEVAFEIDNIVINNNPNREIVVEALKDLCDSFKGRDIVTRCMIADSANGIIELDIDSCETILDKFERNIIENDTLRKLTSFFINLSRKSGSFSGNYS